MDENEKTISRALLLDVESEYSREFVIEQAKQENWYYIYLLSKLVSREVSILVDSNDNYWVDWGTIGSVELSPPVGAVLPFKLWVHTHPSNTAYWSITDRNSLEIAKGILEKAMVLGENGSLTTMLHSAKSLDTGMMNSDMQWTEQEVIPWPSIYFEKYQRVYDTIKLPKFTLQDKYQ